MSMRICSKCGRPLEEGATRCEDCGSTSVTITFAAPPKPEADAGPEETAATADTEADVAEAQPEETWGEAFRKWLRRPWFWLAAAALLAAAGWGGYTAFQPPPVPTAEPTPAPDPRAVPADLRRELQAQVQDLLRERLTWAREIMFERIPSRFPEELVYDLGEEAPEVVFSNDDETAVEYSFEIAYHFRRTRAKTWEWHPVTVSFERQNGRWVRVKDKWPNSWELNFE